MTQSEGFSEEPNSENEVIEAAEGEHIVAPLDETGTLPPPPGKGDTNPIGLAKI
jgi:hypothetical protein